MATKPTKRRKNDVLHRFTQAQEAERRRIAAMTPAQRAAQNERERQNTTREIAEQRNARMEREHAAAKRRDAKKPTKTRKR